MIVIVEATYEHGTLKLAQPLNLPEQTPVRVTVETAPSETKPKYELVEGAGGRLLIRTFDGRKITAEMVREIEALPW